MNFPRSAFILDRTVSAWCNEAYSCLFCFVLVLFLSPTATKSCVSSSASNEETIETASLRHADAVRSRMKAQRGKIIQHRPRLLYPNRKETGRLLSCSQHSYFGTYLFEEWGGGGSLLASDTHGFWCDWAFMVLLADQHRKRSCLAGIPLALDQCTEYL